MINCCPEAIATDTESVATVTKYLISVSNMGPVRSFSSLGSEENKQIGRFH